MAAPVTKLVINQPVSHVSLPKGQVKPVKIIGLNVKQVDGQPALHLVLNADNTCSYIPENLLVGM